MTEASVALRAITRHIANLKRGKENLERLLKQQKKWIAEAESTRERLEKGTKGN
jgi:hypothetical protein